MLRIFFALKIRRLRPRANPRTWVPKASTLPLDHRSRSTVHLSKTLANDQLDAQIFNTFITILYMYMFRAISCSSSGGQIVLIQHLVSSLSVSDRSVHRLKKFLLNPCTGPSLTESDDTRCCINLLAPEFYI